MEAYAQGPDYVVEYGDWIVFRFSKLRESRSSGYAATLRITVHDIPGSPNGTLFNSNVVFGGARSKADAARACEARIKAEQLGFSWLNALEQAVEAVQNLIESGEPFIDLSEAPEPQERSYLVDKLLRYAEPTIIYGQGGSQKSYLALAIAASISQGEPLLGLSAQQERVGILDYEDVQDTHKHRLEMLRRGWDLPARPSLWYKEASVSLVSMADSLSRELTAAGITVLIIDSAAMACNGKPEEAETATAFFRALRSLRLKGMLLLAHHKHGEADHPFGSVFWWNQSRSIWLQKKSQEAGTSKTAVGLIHKKINNGTLFTPLAFEFVFTADSTVTKRVDASTIVDLRAELSFREQVYQAIRDEPGLDRETLFLACTAANPKLTRTTYRQMLHRLRNQITEVNGGIWLRAEEAT